MGFLVSNPPLPPVVLPALLPVDYRYYTTQCAVFCIQRFQYVLLCRCCGCPSASLIRAIAVRERERGRETLVQSACIILKVLPRARRLTRMTKCEGKKRQEKNKTPPTNTLKKKMNQNNKPRGRKYVLKSIPLC